MNKTRNQWYQTTDRGDLIPPCPKYNRLLDRLKDSHGKYEKALQYNTDQVDRGVEPNFKAQDKHGDIAVKLYNKLFSEDIKEPWEIPSTLTLQLA